MAATSYKIRGIAPPDLAEQPAAIRKLYWSWVVEYGLKRKDKELAAGLDKDGNPLRPIAPETRKYRRSAMAPNGKGDPNAPPLTPAHQKSRTRSLLAGRALSTHAEFYWRFDAFTGDSWGVVLAIQAEKGRNVRGLSPAGVAWVKAQALRRWNAWKAGSRQEPAAAKPARAAATVPQVGSYSTAHATFGIGATGPEVFAKGRWTGGMTAPEWAAYFRQSARAAIPGRPNPTRSPHPEVGPAFNRLLGHVWGRGGRSGGATVAKPVAGRPGPSRQKVAMAPKPKPEPVPTAGLTAELLHQAADLVPTALLYSESKAWIHHVWEAYLKLPGARQLTLDEFKRLLVEDAELRALLARADLVQAMDPTAVARSETHYRVGGRVAATFNFVRRRR